MDKVLHQLIWWLSWGELYWTRGDGRIPSGCCDFVQLLYSNLIYSWCVLTIWGFGASGQVQELWQWIPIEDHNEQQQQQQQARKCLPSWEATYISPTKAALKMIFLLHRWDSAVLPAFFPWTIVPANVNGGNLCGMVRPKEHKSRCVFICFWTRRACLTTKHRSI